MTTQTEAQRLASLLTASYSNDEQIAHAAAAELRRLEAENARLQASLEECSGNCTALKDQVRRMRSELERPMSSEATVLVHDNARLRAEVQALRGVVPAVPKVQLTHFDGVIPSAVRGYLRRCSSGGMPKKQIDAVQFNVDEAERLGYFKLAIAEAMLAAAPQPAPQSTGFIVSKHFDPLTGAGIPDPTTFGEKQ
jgi:hypothetical protein